MPQESLEPHAFQSARVAQALWLCHVSPVVLAHQEDQPLSDSLDSRVDQADQEDQVDQEDPEPLDSPFRWAVHVFQSSPVSMDLAARLLSLFLPVESQASVQSHSNSGHLNLVHR